MRNTKGNNPQPHTIHVRKWTDPCESPKI